MQTQYKQSPPYPEVSLNGSVLTIDGQDYDLASLQQDAENIINIRDRGRFLANIVIPPKSYSEVDTGETDEDGNAIYEKQAEPLNIARVRLVVWQKYIEPETQEVI